MSRAAAALALVLLATLALSPGARASLDRLESYTQFAPDSLDYFVVENYSAADARNARTAADTDASGSVSSPEAAAYADNASSSRLGNASSYVRWDGAAAFFRSVNASVVGLEGPVTSGAPFTLTLDAALALSSGTGENHTLAITKPAAYGLWTVSLIIPPSWSFGNVSGALSVDQNGSRVTASLDVGVALFVLVAPPPPPPSGVFRNETYTVVNNTTAQYLGLERHEGSDAANVRAEADADADQVVSRAEASAFLVNASIRAAAALAASVRWDAAPACATVQLYDAAGLEGPRNGSAAVVFTLDAVLALTAGSSPDHTLTVTRPAGFSNWSLTLNLPGPWSFGSAAGVLQLNHSGPRVQGEVAEGVAVVEVAEPAPQAPPAAAPAPGPGSLLPWAGLAAAIAFGSAAAIVALRRRGRGAAAPPAPASPPYLLEGFLLLYRDGRLLYHQEADGSGRLTEPEVLGSMFAAVSEFIQDSFHERATNSRLTHGHNTILLERSPHLFGAAVLFGEPDQRLRDELKHALEQAEAAFAGVVEKWGGDKMAFEGASAIVRPLFALTAGITRAQVSAGAVEHSVKMLSESEHYRGYIRLKVAVVNDTDRPIGDAAVSVTFNTDVLRLARVDPPTFVRNGAEVQVGTVNPGERMCANYLLDPQTCNQTNIEGRLTYRDASGRRRAATMKTRHAEIICPIFFTPQQANAASLERRMEAALFVRDARSYRVVAPQGGVSFGDLFAAARDAVQRHDVKLVRSLTTPPPSEGKAWFFGQTKVGARDVIVRAGARQRDDSVEFYVATDSPSSLTGLLAEICRSFRELVAQRMAGASLEPIYDDAPLAPIIEPGAPADGEA